MAIQGFSYSDRIVKPHKKISRPVEEADLFRARKEAEVLLKLCYTPVGVYRAALAMSHPQIDDQDPLQLIVLAETKDALINPQLLDWTKHKIDSKEGCYTFPNNMPIYCNRSHKITVKVDLLRYPYKGELEPMILELSGKRSFVVQHELDHLIGKYIYDYGDD